MFVVNALEQILDQFLSSSELEYIYLPLYFTADILEIYNVSFHFHVCSHAILIYLSCAFPGVADHW